MRLMRWIDQVMANRFGRVPRPAWCTYLVTYRCNGRCGMCDSWRLKPGTELTPSEAAEAFRKLGRLDVVRLTGGEPFLRDDLPELAEAVGRASRPGVLHVTTNGSRPQRVAELVERYPEPRRLHFLVSLDGLAEVHDRHRGRAANFARACETLRRLVALRQKYGIGVSVNHNVVSPDSLADAPSLHRLAAGLGVEVQTVVAYADSAMYGRRRQGTRAEDLIIAQGYPLYPELERTEVVRFLRGELRRLRRTGPVWLRWGKRYYLRGLLARLEAHRRTAPRPRCTALRSHIRLLPDGRVPVCQFNTETVGRLGAAGLGTFWWGPRAQAARAWVDACPGCWAECEVIPSAIYSADLFRPWV